MKKEQNIKKEWDAGDRVEMTTKIELGQWVVNKAMKQNKKQRVKTCMKRHNPITKYW